MPEDEPIYETVYVHPEAADDGIPFAELVEDEENTVTKQSSQFWENLKNLLYGGKPRLSKKVKPHTSWHA